ncbi:unnamed protein product [Parascedosporium putredinis]|uniref:Uncharacterized protein n=1 Tax=Parascedosporium putredinis TaxID=1442378 RepID=A0A9P1MCH8_9PEZI|nr:unnamed protein product [Parascedosporium putredinis]CAI8001581.1 unnamed protein product [Parascedosporium putredinis]
MAQLGAATEYVTLYDPIVGASDGHGRRAEPTPEPLLIRSFNLRQAYSDIKDDLVSEMAAFDSDVIKPGNDARDAIQPLRRTIKKRENKRLDYEKQQEKTQKLQRKPGKSTEKPETKHHKSSLETGPIGPGVATDFTVATGLANSNAVQAPDSRATGGTFGYATNRTADLANLAIRKKPPPPPPPKK